LTAFSLFFNYWRLTLDFLLVWILLYQLIHFVKGTLLVQVLAGAAFLFVLYLLANVLNLPSLKLLTHQIFNNTLLLMIIIFQDDLRRLLAKLGRSVLIKFNFSQQEHEVLKEIVIAVKHFSHEQIGSLIVFERGMRLDKFYDHSVFLDAAVSSHLLISIFQNFSPLHDGAVIISDKKIRCSCAQLPLSQHPKLARSYGMRHSAGVGITEQTDCFVIVTSEENGSISFATEGELKKVKKAEDLLELLNFFLFVQQKQEKPFVATEWEQVQFKRQKEASLSTEDDLIVPEPLETEEKKEKNQEPKGPK
jgi:diadenylate cyclase